MTAPKVDLSRVQLHHMAKPATEAAWLVVAKALLRGVLIGAVLAAVFAAGMAVVASHAPAKAAKVVV
jgi:hypothetical protein